MTSVGAENLGLIVAKQFHETMLETKCLVNI